MISTCHLCYIYGTHLLFYLNPNFFQSNTVPYWTLRSSSLLSRSFLWRLGNFFGLTTFGDSTCLQTTTSSSFLLRLGDFFGLTTFGDSTCLQTTTSSSFLWRLLNFFGLTTFGDSTCLQTTAAPTHSSSLSLVPCEKMLLILVDGDESPGIRGTNHTTVVLAAPCKTSLEERRDDSRLN